MHRWPAVLAALLCVLLDAAVAGAGEAQAVPQSVLIRDQIPPPPDPAWSQSPRKQPEWKPPVWERPAWEQPVCEQRAIYWYDRYFAPQGPEDWASLLAGAGLAAGSALILADANLEDIASSSDFFLYALPATAFAVPALHGNLKDSVRYGLVLGTALGVTVGSKSAFKKTRPNGTDEESYPSGHTAAAFSAAAFLYNRYGPRFGIPAYVAAIHTGVARVLSDWHFLDDVIAGAGVGMISAGVWEMIWTPRPATPPQRRTWRIEFGFGAAWQTENVVTAPTGAGTALDIAGFDGAGGALPTARVSIHWFPDARTELMVRIDPLEFRGRTVLPQDSVFGMTTFPAGTSVSARSVGTEYKGRWRYEMLPADGPSSLRVGATLIFADYRVELEAPGRIDSVGVLRPIPVPHAFFSYDLTPELTVFGNVDGLPLVDFTGIDVEAGVRYRLPRGWDVGLFYRCSRRFIENVDHDVTTQGGYLTVGRSF